MREDDLDDVPDEGRALAESRRDDFKTIKAANRWKQAVQAYLASISYADAQVGRLIAALDVSGLTDRTIIVLWSDHGWHLGEKNHWHKMTLWEEATRVPFIIVAPGVTAPHGRCPCPVSLIDIFPTLNELCGLTALNDLDGTSLVPLLRNPAADHNTCVVTQYKPGQCAVRSTHHRYIRYSDGTEELYDHRDDPNEWTNLANDPHLQKLKTSLSKHATRHWTDPAPAKKAYHFDPETYTWTEKSGGKVVTGD